MRPTFRSTRWRRRLRRRSATRFGKTRELGLVRGRLEHCARRTACSRPTPSAPRSTTGTRARSFSSRTINHSIITRALRREPTDRERHLKDYTDSWRESTRGMLPQVVFYKPQGSLTSIRAIPTSIWAIGTSRSWSRKSRPARCGRARLIIVTYDENGGFWDHVPPPKGGGSLGSGHAFQPSSSRRSQSAATSTLRHTIRPRFSKLITRRFGLEPLSGVRRNVGDLTAVFDFAHGRSAE